jgi:hypothetical protein
LVRLIGVAKDVDCLHKLHALLSKHKAPKRPSSAIKPLETPDAPQECVAQAGSVMPAVLIPQEVKRG